MVEEHWELLSEGARRRRAEDAAVACRAIAEMGREDGALHPGDVYPTSLGEWLGHCVELAGRGSEAGAVCPAADARSPARPDC